MEHSHCHPGGLDGRGHRGFRTRNARGAACIRGAGQRSVVGGSLLGCRAGMGSRGLLWFGLEEVGKNWSQGNSVGLNQEQ